MVRSAALGEKGMVICRMYVQGVSPSKIAEEMGVSVETVKSHLRNARTLLVTFGYSPYGVIGLRTAMRAEGYLDDIAAI